MTEPIRRFGSKRRFGQSGMFLAQRFCHHARVFSLVASLPPARRFAVANGNRDFITSDGVDKEQLTPALQQYFKFKEQYKGNGRLSL